jgi:serine/threonine protein kinase
MTATTPDPAQVNELVAARGIDEFQLEHELGKGTYGVVTRAVHKPTDVPVALKTILVESSNDGIPATAIREVCILRKFHHDNIVRLYTVLPGEDRSLTLVCECLDFDLSKLIKIQQPPGLPLDVVRTLTQQMLRGIHEVHQKRVLHRDLKPQNILLDRQLNLKLADFGLARTCDVPVPNYTTEVITRWYRPLEILLGETHYTPAVDLWSVGCIMVEMITGTPLFPGDEDTQLEKVVSIYGTPTIEEWPDWIHLPNAHRIRHRHVPRRSIGELVPRLLQHPLALELIERLLDYNPKTRLTAAAALQHRYFQMEETNRVADPASSPAPTGQGTGSGGAPQARTQSTNSSAVDTPSTVRRNGVDSSRMDSRADDEH